MLEIPELLVKDHFRLVLILSENRLETTLHYQIIPAQLNVDQIMDLAQSLLQLLILDHYQYQLPIIPILFVQSPILEMQDVATERLIQENDVMTE